MAKFVIVLTLVTVLLAANSTAQGPEQLLAKAIQMITSASDKFTDPEKLKSIVGMLRKVISPKTKRDVQFVVNQIKHDVENNLQSIRPKRSLDDEMDKLMAIGQQDLAIDEQFRAKRSPIKLDKETMDEIAQKCKELVEALGKIFSS